MIKFETFAKERKYYDRSRKHYTDLSESERINLQYYLNTFDGHISFSRHSTKRLKERTTDFTRDDIKTALKHNNILEASYYNSYEGNENKLRVLIESKNSKNNHKLFIVVVIEREVIAIVSTWLEKSDKIYTKLTDSDQNLNVTELLEAVL